MDQKPLCEMRLYYSVIMVNSLIMNKHLTNKAHYLIIDEHISLRDYAYYYVHLHKNMHSTYMYTHIAYNVANIVLVSYIIHL